MATTDQTKRPITLVNWGYALVLVTLIAAAAWRGLWHILIAAVVVAIALVIVIARARRGLGSTQSRVNALQTYDERDRRILDRAYSWLGQFALLAQSAIFAFTVVAGGDATNEGIRALVLVVVSYIATSVSFSRADG